MPLVTRDGFSAAEPVAFVPPEMLPDAGAAALDLPNDADPEPLAARFRQIPLIRIQFPRSDDGRGFSLARRLRDLGYGGRLRAAGHVISDQFRYALSCGFDEVEISDGHAARQPEEHWRDGGRTYRDKLAGRGRPRPGGGPARDAHPA